MLWGKGDSFIVLWAFLAMHISLTYLLDIKTGVELAYHIYNDYDKGHLITRYYSTGTSHITTATWLASPHFINDDYNRVINYIISNHSAIKIIKSNSYFRNLFDFLLHLSTLPPSPIDLDKQPNRPPEFLVSDRYINYLNSIIAKQKAIDEEEKLKAAETAEAEKELTHTKKRLLMQTAIKKHHDILTQMPQPTGKKDLDGNPLYKHDKLFDGNPFSIINFNGNYQEFNNLFDLKHYGWTETDQDDLFIFKIDEYDQI